MRIAVFFIGDKVLTLLKQFKEQLFLFKSK